MPYATLWQRALSVVAVLGLLLSLAMHSPLTVLGALLCAYVVTLLTIAVSQPPAFEGQPIDWARVHDSSVLLACLLVALPAWVEISAGATLQMLLVAICSSPPVVTRLRRLARDTRDERSAVVRSTRGAGHGGHQQPSEQVTRMLELGPTPERVAALDTAALCLAWRRSFLMLAAASTAAERAVVADLRQLYLDELDQRYPRSVASWLASQPAASSGPDGFLPLP